MFYIAITAPTTATIAAAILSSTGPCCEPPAAVALLALPVALPVLVLPVELPPVAVGVIEDPKSNPVVDWLAVEEEDTVVVGTVKPVAEETIVLVHEHDGSNESIVKT